LKSCQKLYSPNLKGHNRLVGENSLNMETMNMEENPIRYLQAESEKIEAELEPFIDGIRKMPKDSKRFKMFSKSYTDYADRYDHYSKVVQYFSKGMYKVTENPKDKMQWILYYLGLLEGINNTTLNILIMLLKANQNRINITYAKTSPRIEHALSLSELEEKYIPLTAKLSFLSQNGLREIAQLIDSELRNKVAHFKFDITDDDICLDGKRAMPRIAHNMFNVLVVFHGVHNCLGKLNRTKSTK
jgi:hypothetical protein